MCNPTFCPQWVQPTCPPFAAMGCLCDEGTLRRFENSGGTCMANARGHSSVRSYGPLPRRSGSFVAEAQHYLLLFSPGPKLDLAFNARSICANNSTSSVWHRYTHDSRCNVCAWCAQKVTVTSGNLAFDVDSRRQLDSFSFARPKVGRCA